MSSSSLTPDEIRAAAETHNELGRDYSSAVIESFLDKVGREIDARVDARLNRYGPPPQYAPAPQQTRAPAERKRRQWSPMALGFASLIFGIPITAIVVNSPAHLAGLVVVWVAIAVINVAYAVSHANAQQQSHARDDRR